MNLLVIGGSAFLGRAIVDAALHDGHAVSVFNRGLTRTAVRSDVEHIIGDRMTDLARARVRRWGAIVDTCAYTSQSVDLVGRHLRDVTDSYTFISSVSAYESFQRANVTEDLPVLDGSLPEENLEDESTYGQRKALCESSTNRWFERNSVIIRLGMLVGPHDNFPRFPYWLRRIAAGGQFIVPGSADRWIQLVDVRDAARFILLATCERQFGTYNVTGPSFETTMGMMVSTCREASRSDAEPVWIPDDYLVQKGFSTKTFPYWVQSERFPGFFSVSPAKAVQAGLRYRPLLESARDTLLWLRNSMFSEDDDASARTLIASLSAVGPSLEQERSIIRAWQGQAAFAV